MGQVHAVVDSRKLASYPHPRSPVHNVPFGRPMRTCEDLSRQDNRVQAAHELRRALEAGDAAMLAWAKAWAEPVMREVLRTTD